MIYVLIGKFSAPTPPAAKKRKTREVIVVSKAECIRMLDEKKFSTFEYKGRAPFWQSYRMIQTSEKKDTNYVRCRCGRIDEYAPEKGTKHLSGHHTSCNSLAKNASMEKFVLKEKVITKEEKAELTHAVTEFCYKDMRPFYAVEGPGLMKVLEAVSTLSAKYGVLYEKHLRSFLPCPNTVSSYDND